MREGFFGFLITYPLYFLFIGMACCSVQCVYWDVPHLELRVR